MFEKRSLVDNLADEEQVSRAEGKEKRKTESFSEDLKALLKNPQGRRVLWHYISLCGVFRSNYSPEQGLTYFNLGQRNIGIRIIDDIVKTDSETFMLMMKEQEKEQNNG